MPLFFLGRFTRLLRPVLYVSTTFLLCFRAFAATDEGIIDTPSVNGLRAEVESTNILLSWPSDPRENYVVLRRSNANYQSPWVIITNQLRAAPTGSRTMLLDVGEFARTAQNEARTNLTGFYGVYVIPDFWFDMKGATLGGGTARPSEDFLPFYYGNDATDFFRPEVGLMVDGEEAGWGPLQIERVNFGTPSTPRYNYVAGFWIRHDVLGNGRHTLQLRSTLELNNFVGQWSQAIIVSNRPVEIIIPAMANDHAWFDKLFGNGSLGPSEPQDDHKGRQYEQTSRPQVKILPRPLSLLDPSLGPHY